MQTRYAGFTVRFLASILDCLILFLPNVLFWVYISSANSLKEFLLRLVIYLIFLFIPLFAIFYNSIFTFYFGGNLGKLLTGIRVEKDGGGKLSFRRLLFRYSIGYMFSWLIFGLGYLNIITDKKKQAWHDKAVDSVVITKKTLWPLSILLIILFISGNIFLIYQAFNNLKSSPLQKEALGIGVNIFTTINKSDYEKAQVMDSLDASSSAQLKELFSSQKVSQDFLLEQIQIYSLIQKEDFKQANSKAESLLKNSKTPLEKSAASRIMGEISLLQGDKNFAKNSFLDAIRYDSTSAITYNYLAQLELSDKNYSQALEYAEKAVELEPKNSAYKQTLELIKNTP